MPLDDRLVKELRCILPPERILLDEPMAGRTTFRVGGPADCLAQPASLEEAHALLMLTRNYGTPLTVLGNGSNVLVRDKGIRGLVISFGKPFAYIHREDTSLLLGPGTILGAVSQFAASQGLSGLEFAVGIPGSVGGAIFMNAGAYDGEMKTFVQRVTALTASGEIASFTGEELGFSYRHSVFQENGALIGEVALSLTAGDIKAIKEKMADFTQRRQQKQPLEYPSAGSTFKRPPGNFAGTLIEKTGLKGLTIGGAQVSEKHAGFLINRGGATANDILRLMAEVQHRVYETHGVRLVPEVRIVGEE